MRTPQRSPEVSFIYRKCCASNLALGAWVEAVNEPPIGRGDVLDVPLSTSITWQREIGVARHEASHAVTAHVLGVSIASVSIDVPALISYVRPSDDAAKRVALAVAGPIADDLLAGVKPGTGVVEIRTTMRRIRSCRFGACDSCAAAFDALIAAGGAQASDRDVFRIIRRIERRVIAFLENPKTQIAVSALASALMEKGVLDGETAHEIIRAAGPAALEI
ncbi:zinc metalloprotease [Brucella haematophila]|uniref:hypothetical protein n=1 Tax=Brucella haematophila TaxID=419474 RepID=UPI00110E4F9F|nr:hypothetical protein [Brucella haematophila]